MNDEEKSGKDWVFDQTGLNDKAMAVAYEFLRRGIGEYTEDLPKGITKVVVKDFIPWGENENHPNSGFIDVHFYQEGHDCCSAYHFEFKVGYSGCGGVPFGMKESVQPVADS